MVTTLQAVSGAGYPGVASMDIIANVIPFIGSEEEKMQSETQKILGDLVGDEFRPLAGQGQRPLQSRPGRRRTPVLRFGRARREARSRGASRSLRELHAACRSRRTCPALPPRPVIYMEQADRPQPRRDVERENGMAVFVGRLRECPVFDYKFLACGHNTVRGAAGAAVLNAELMHSEGMLD